MNKRSFKLLKIVVVLLMSIEFLTPATLTEFLPYGQSDQSNLHLLPASSQKNPVLFLAEETGREEVQRENHDQKMTVPMVHSVVAPCRQWIDKFKMPIVATAGKDFDTRPPLFTLHCLLLL